MKRFSRTTPLKGKAIVGQSGGCTAVINQSLAGVISAARDLRCITHLWGALYGVTGILKGEFTDLRFQPRGLMRQISGQPSSVLGSARYKLEEGQEFQVLRSLRKWDVRYLFLIGGNDTAETLLRIAKAAEEEHYELRTVHIPKTIDNDLAETDHSPGYGSVARFAAITTQETGLDTKAMRYADPVKIIELMGRNSGWVVSASALLKRSEVDPPHLLLIPEVSFDEGRFVGQVDRVLSQAGYCIIVISETIRNTRGERVGARKEGILQDAFGHPYVEGTASCLVKLIEKHLKVRARYDKPGTVQRMSIPYVSHVDQEEAFRVGHVAVRWACEGISKVMVSLVRIPGKKYRVRYRTVPLEKIPHRERYVPRSFLNKDKTNIGSSFVRYALPLIGKQIPKYHGLKPIVPKVDHKV